MTWISLICCLLALSSTAFGRSAYGSYSSAPLTQMPSAMRDLTSQQQPILAQLPVQSGYGSSWPQSIQQDTPVQQPLPVQQPSIPTSYGSSYGAQQIPRRHSFIQADQTLAVPQSYNRQQQFQVPQRSFPSAQQLLLEQQQLLQQKIQESIIPTEADIACRGKPVETVITLDDARRFIVCVDDGKGVEQQCPKGLHFHSESRRCERKLGPLESPCSLQPCLNGGQCVQADVSSYQCQCAAGFDGKTCELDATVCQTQQPCGQSPDTRCQSFRLGAALQYICILQGGAAYGLSAQQAQSSPCTGTDGTQPLVFSDKGFIMCDGESMFVESCPGGTVWDSLNTACVWPDMQGVVGRPLADQSQQGYGQSYGSVQRPMPTPFQLPQRPVQLEQPKMISSYGQSPVKSSYGSQPQLQVPQQDQPMSSYTAPQPMRLPQQDQPMSSYTAQQPMRLPQQDQSMSSYTAPQPMRLPQQDQPMRLPQQDQPMSSYGSQQQDQTQQMQVPQQQSVQKPQVWQQPQTWQQPIQRQQDIRPIQQQASGY